MSIAHFASRVGAPVEKAYTQADLPVCCDDPNAWVPVHNAWAWFESASRLVDPAVGWLAGQSIGGRSLREELAGRIWHAPTLYVGLQALVREASSESSDLSLSLRMHQDSVSLSTEYWMKSWPGYHVDQGYQLTVMIDLIRYSLKRPWSPRKIGIEATQVPDGVRDMFPGTRFLTGQPRGFIELDCRLLHRKWRGLPARVCPDETSPKNPREFRAIVRALIEAYLRDGPVTAGKIARLLNVSERSLFRRLRRQRSTFQIELDTARFEFAKHLIRERDLPFGKVAALIGISDAGNFSRMFRCIGGLSPSQYRNSLNA